MAPARRAVINHLCSASASVGSCWLSASRPTNGLANAGSVNSLATEPICNLRSSRAEPVSGNVSLGSDSTSTASLTTAALLGHER